MKEMTTMTESILAYNPGARWWARVFVEVPEDVKRRLAIAKAAHGIANQLAPLEPEANREILYQAAALLGVLNEKEAKP
jgi:hypothetical protein